MKAIFGMLLTTLMFCILLAVFLFGCFKTTDQNTLDTKAKQVIVLPVQVIYRFEDWSPAAQSPLRMWLLADYERNLCFAVFSRGDSLAVTNVNCATIKPNIEKGTTP